MGNKTYKDSEICHFSKVLRDPVVKGMLGHAFQLKDKLLDLVPATIKRKQKHLAGFFRFLRHHTPHLRIMLWPYTRWQERLQLDHGIPSMHVSRTATSHWMWAALGKVWPWVRQHSAAELTPKGADSWILSADSSPSSWGNKSFLEGESGQHISMSIT